MRQTGTSSTDFARAALATNRYGTIDCARTVLATNRYYGVWECRNANTGDLVEKAVSWSSWLSTKQVNVVFHVYRT